MPYEAVGVGGEGSEDDEVEDCEDTVGALGGGIILRCALGDLT